MHLVEMLEPVEGEPGQYLGVYITKWRQEFGPPTVMFRDVETRQMTGDPDIRALVEAAWATIANINDPYPEFGTLKALRRALAPFQEPTEEPEGA